MRLKHLGLLGLCATSLVLSACGDDAEDTVRNVTTVPELQSSWISGCAGSSVLDLSTNTKLIFEGSDFQRIQRYYQDTQCSSAEQLVVEYAGSFSVDEDAIEADDEGHINIKLEKAVVTPKDQSVADRLNTIRFCGVTDWQANKSQSLSGEDTENLCPLMNVPVTKYGIYKLTNEDKTLLLDNEISDMSEDSADRDTTPDTEFTKE